MADGTSQYIGGIKYQQGIKYDWASSTAGRLRRAERRPELTHQDIEDLGHAPPNRLTACVIGVGSCVGAARTIAISLQWLDVEPRQPRRVQGVPRGGKLPSTRNSVIAVAHGQRRCRPTATSFKDGEELPDGVNFTYWIKAVFGGSRDGAVDPRTGSNRP